MKRNIGYYIFIVIEFFLISCLIYQLAIKGTYIYYKGVTAFILLELLTILLTPIYFRIYLQAGQILTCLVVLMLIFIVTHYTCN